MVKLAIDAMGGDYGPAVVVPASIQALKNNSDLEVIFVGEEHKINLYLPAKLQQQYKDRITILHTDEYVLMDEVPSSALRTKRKSSMRLALNLVKEQQADACVSAGNTGALMATAHIVLKTVPGIDRAAIIASMPNIMGKCRVLDLGANVDTTSEHLLQFAVMGSVIAEYIDGIKMPKIGLLNIGAEEIKGNDQVKQTAQKIIDSKVINYIGYVEGDAFFTGGADVIVCNGFVGNVALKSGEGMARFVKHTIESVFKKSLLTKIFGLMAYPILRLLRKEIDPSQYNGATLLGLNGVVIKSHGGANIFGFECAIHEAVKEVKHNIPKLIAKKVTELL